MQAFTTKQENQQKERNEKKSIRGMDVHKETIRIAYLTSNSDVVSIFIVVPTFYRTQRLISMVVRQFWNKL
ncbi:hypothetical protein [Leptospira noguchii]|uniref:Transposase domain protein n=2 Tax=Leptospira noguchii TaxID=28182 RepID=M6YN12_9LEPT|nr:hypothetical protein [Leptospira noguchii]EKR72126.1 hypothetical protein LEP1GSC041_0981 [Leptospira noguchii str. 2006001870]EMO41005.1 hypothetical protein LEP1GSC186_4376 [Leptospira noguchii serovar Autumnalis str. ZUN142]EMO87718.1 hypothetical protein LEP1GSC024_3510 [Leptospira noguchii str. 2001034031]UOG45034.1 hypothetical protein MAL01_17240 [Leptospira noguchii]UOG48724.1 hypothetical protein MAL00_17410 [Leptospira noguchii]